jgi:hypothetical protein
MSNDDALLAAVLRKLVADPRDQSSRWWYDGDPWTDDYVPVSFGVDVMAELTEQEALAVMRAMYGSVPKNLERFTADS